MARKKKSTISGSKKRKQAASETHQRQFKQDLVKPVSQTEKPPRSPTPELKIAHTQPNLEGQIPSVLHTEPLENPNITNAFRRAYDLQTINVSAGCKIEAKVRQVLTALEKSTESKQPIAVEVLGRASAANKCISIIEISKREYIGTDKRKLFQYTGYWSRLELRPLRTKSTQEHGGGGEDQDSDDAFEPLVSKPKVRNTPCLAIYLCTKTVSPLKALYSEQLVT